MFKFLRKENKDESWFLLNCGHEVLKRNQHVKNKQVKCKICYEEKLKQEAEKTGVLEFISSEKGMGVYKRYKFAECGHFKFYQPNVIRNSKSFFCDHCFEERLHEEASSVGLELLKVKFDEKGKRLYLLPCGCEKSIRTDHVRSENFNCQKCKPDRYSKPSKFYIFKIISQSFSFLKVGFSKNTYLRFKNLGLSSDFHCEVVFTKKFETGLESRKFESIIHEKFSNFKINPEEMKSYVTNGYTECYPIDILEKLLIEVNLKNE